MTEPGFTGSKAGIGEIQTVDRAPVLLLDPPKVEENHILKAVKTVEQPSVIALKLLSVFAIACNAGKNGHLNS